MLTCHRPQCIVCHFCDKGSNLLERSAQLVNHFVRINCSIVDYSFNLQRYCVFGDDLLRLKCHYVSLHVDWDYSFSPWVDYMKTWLDDSVESTEFLKDAELRCLQL